MFWSSFDPSWSFEIVIGYVSKVWSKSNPMFPFFIEPDVGSVKEIFACGALVICFVGWSDVSLWNPKLAF